MLMRVTGVVFLAYQEVIEFLKVVLEMLGLGFGGLLQFSLLTALMLAQWVLIVQVSKSHLDPNLMECPSAASKIKLSKIYVHHFNIAPVDFD